MHAFLLAALLSVCSIASGTALAAPQAAQGTVDVLFTPWDDAEGALVRALGDARKTIHVQAYLITSRPIANALFAAVVRGVKVELLADREMAIKTAMRRTTCNSTCRRLAPRRGGEVMWCHRYQ